MRAFFGIDVSLASSAFCILDEHGQVLKRAQLASEPEAFVALLGGLPWSIAAIGQLSQWLHHGLAGAGFDPVLMETRQVKAVLKAMPVETDRGPSFARGRLRICRTACRCGGFADACGRL